MLKVIKCSYKILITGFVLIITHFSCKGQTIAEKENEQLEITQREYGLDPAVPLTGRIKETSPEILNKFREAGMSPTIHNLTEADSLKVVNAFESLPAVHQRVLKDHLLGISFLDNMPNTALTATVNPGDSIPVFTITFRAEILEQNVSQWLTEKEQSYFKPGGQDLKVSIEAGEMDAIFYVLLHETTHVVDGALGIIGKNRELRKSLFADQVEEFTTGTWLNRTTVVPTFLDSTFNRSIFHPGGEKLSITSAQKIYESAAYKPFVSLYSFSSWHEDFAEYLTVNHFTNKLKQPFKIVITEKGKEVFSYEPMKSKLIQSRIPLMEPFYE